MDDRSKTRRALWLTVTALSLLSSIPTATAAPSRSIDHGEALNGTQHFVESGFPVLGLKARDTSIPLRIMPLGASIMSGVGSSNGNGLRKPLRDALRKDGYDVNYVGSFDNGPMKDNDHEAHSGDIITQIESRAKRTLGYRPNVVIINAGTNDANGAVDLPNAGNRMNSMLNIIWNGDGMSQTCIMLSTLLPTNNGNGAANSPGINDKYRDLVKQRAGEGKCIYLAEMHPMGQGNPWFNLNTDYMAGESPAVHPNDKGHAMMASVFYNSIRRALRDNKLVMPGEMVLGEGVCDKFEGTGTDAGGLTQRGSGYDDGIYYHQASEKGILWEATSDWDRGQWKFARLYSPKHDDLVAWIPDSDTTQVYATWANSADGKGRFIKGQDMKGDLDCRYAEGVNFIDMNGDGLDDLVYVDADGNAYLSINQGDGIRGAGKPPTFKRVSSSAKIMDTNGYNRPFIVLADIDGDGRGDFGRVDFDGNVRFWRNGGNTDAPEYWQDLGIRWETKNYEKDPAVGGGVGLKFEDVNGDGRDDAVWLDTAGAGHLWTNSRSCKKGKEGGGLNVAWREGFLTGTTEKAYKGMGGFINDKEKNLRGRIHFARIYGEENIFGNLPRKDYVFMEHAENGKKHDFKMRVWANAGGGATKLVADGNRYCNMMGHKNGMADYAWFWSVGKLELWANRGKGTIKDSDPDGYWDYKGVIWNPPRNINRKDLHLSDWNNDGACDIIYADPMTGAVTVWINNFPGSGRWEWTEKSYPNLKCDQKRGVGIFDLAVRFADLTGNGRADYMCLHPDSKIMGQVHNDDDSFGPVSQIKISIKKDRANLRFADVNGDGREDLLWIEKFSGDTFVWYNEGVKKPEEAAGSIFGWRVQDKIAYAGLVAGTCIYYADLNGDGFADEHYVLKTFENVAQTSLHPGCGLTDATGDDADMNVNLPAVPGDDSGGGTGPGIPETGNGCVEGTGPGLFEDVCKYACARGFCPPPCTCTRQGTYNTGPAEDNLDGFAAPGLDQAFTPLCNFTCTYGYCPDECTIGVEMDPDLQELPSIPIPALDDPDDEDTARHKTGDFFRYEFEGDSTTAFSVLYTGDRVDQLPNNLKCDQVADGPDGNFIGCVGETLEWLMLSLLENETVMKAISKRDGESANYTGTPGHTFTPLPRWAEATEEDCGLHCTLTKRGRSDEWVAVGEGTFNDSPHSMHVKHTGNTLMYRSTAASLAQHAEHEKRALPLVVAGGVILMSAVVNGALISQISGPGHPNNRPILAAHTAKVGMEATADHYLETCVFVQVNESSIVDMGYAPEGFGIIVGTGSAVSSVTAEKADKTIAKCNVEEGNRHEYVVWPTDGNNVGTLRETLLRFDPATREYQSQNDWGVMYFRSFLTLEQATRVTMLKQCEEVEVKCTDSCKNPSKRYHAKGPRHQESDGLFKPNQLVNKTAKLVERDGDWETQLNASPDLAFISNPQGVWRDPYVYDKSPARRVRLYILEAGYTDLSLHEFSDHKDSTGKTMAQKIEVQLFVGPPGFQGNREPRGDDHGTAMLSMAAGAIYGVAREAEPMLVEYDWRDGRQWAINALDIIESEWKAAKNTGRVTDIGVINLSWGYSAFGAGFKRSLSERLNRLASLGLLPITAAGNSGLPVREVPALFALPGHPQAVPSLMVVGAVDNDGRKWVKSDTADYVTVYAPGVGCEAPIKNDNANEPYDNIYDLDGTSASSAKTAGLAAYFMGLPETAANIRSVQALKDYIVANAYPRSGGPKAIHNNAPL